MDAAASLEDCKGIVQVVQLVAASLSLERLQGIPIDFPKQGRPLVSACLAGLLYRLQGLPIVHTEKSELGVGLSQLALSPLPQEAIYFPYLADDPERLH